MVDILSRLKQGYESHSVLIIDDDTRHAESLKRVLQTFFHECVIASDGQKGVDTYRKRTDNDQAFTVVITDLELSKKGGLSVIKEIRSINPSQSVLLLSAYDEAEYMSAAIALQVQGYLLKPLSMPKLLESLEIIFHQSDKTVLLHNDARDPITSWRRLSALEHKLNGPDFEGGILMRIRVDHLNNMRDLVGNEYVDEYVRELAQVLESLVEKGKGEFFRSSEHEFSLLLINETFQYAQTLAADMVSVARYFHTSERGIVLNSTLSIGIALGKENLLIQSIIALSHMHDSHGGRIGVYPQESSLPYENTFRGREVLQLIFNALEEENIFPLFQPIVSADTKITKMYQSLIRIRKDDKIYGPETFLNIAITTHQMTMITRSIIRTSFLKFSQMQQNDEKLLINLSADDLNDEGLEAYILFWTERYNLSPDSLCFEIIEGNKLISNHQALSLIDSLKNSGYKILLNGFGSPQSGLAVFLALQPHYVKIHDEVVNQLLEVPNRVQMLTKIIEILRLGGAKVIAKYVSDPAKIEPLVDVGFDYLEGYAIAKPFEGAL